MDDKNKITSNQGQGTVPNQNGAPRPMQSGGNPSSQVPPRPMQGVNPQARPMQGGVRPAQNGVRPVQNGARPMQGAQPAQNGPRPMQGGVRPVQNGVRPVQNNAQGGKGVSPVSSAGLPPKSSGGKKPINKKKIFAIGAAIGVVVIAVAVALGILLSPPKIQKISFITGPFAAVGDVDVKKNTYIDKFADLDDIYNEDGQLLVDFICWEYEDGREFRGGIISDDITLRARYSLGKIKSTFVTFNNYSSGGQYLYFGEITTDYYTGTVSFSDAANLIRSFNDEVYQGFDNIYSYNIENKNVSTLPTDISIEEFSRFIENYFSLSSFYALDNESVKYTTVDSIPTPDRDTIFVVEYSPQEVNINFNSNVAMVEDDYKTMSDYDSSDYISIPSENIPFYYYGRTLTFPTYDDMRLNYNFNMPKYHNFIGWSLSQDTDETVTKYYRAGETVSLDKDFLNNGKALTFYAVWSLNKASLLVYNYEDPTKILVSDTINLGGIELSLEERLSEYMDSIIKEGYALLGFNNKLDLSGEVITLDTSISFDTESPWYDNDSRAVILYAVYRKVIDTLTINLCDQSRLDRDYINSVTFSGNVIFDGEGLDNKTWLEDVMSDTRILEYLNVNPNIVISGNENYKYDSSNIVVTFDSENRTLVIRGLLEGSSFTLPSFARKNYELVTLPYAVTSSMGREDRYNALSSYTLSSGDSRSSAGEIIELTLNWVGTNVNLKGDIDDGEGGKLNYLTTYGTELTILIDTKENGNKTDINIQIVDEDGNVVKDYNYEIEGYELTSLETTDENGDPVEIKNGDTFFVGQDLNEFTANLEKREFSIVYDLNDGTYTKDDTTYDETFTYKDKYVK